MPGATSAEFVLPIYEPLQVVVANVLKRHMALGHELRSGTLQATLPRKHLKNVLV